MPRTTFTATLHRPADEVFPLVADLARLAEWDHRFTSTLPREDGPTVPGTRLHAVGWFAGRAVDLELTVVDLDAPSCLRVEGVGAGLRTHDELRFEPDGRGCRITYTAEVETDRDDLSDATVTPALTATGQRTLRGLQDWLGS